MSETVISNNKAITRYPTKSVIKNPVAVTATRIMAVIASCRVVEVCLKLNTDTKVVVLHKESIKAITDCVVFLFLKPLSDYKFMSASEHTSKAFVTEVGEQYFNLQLTITARQLPKFATGKLQRVIAIVNGFSFPCALRPVKGSKDMYITLSKD